MVLRGEPLRVYAGRCAPCGAVHAFENDAEAGVAALSALFAEIADGEAAFRAALEASGGKMIGALVAEDASGARRVLRAFSGEIGNRTDWPGWAPPVVRRLEALEAEVVPALAKLTRRVDANGVAAAEARLAAIRQEISAARAVRREERAERRWARGSALRAGAAAETVAAMRAETLAAEAVVRADEEARVAAARAEIGRNLEELRALREERRAVSLGLWEAMLDAATLTNGRGVAVPIRAAYGADGVPGGTTDCAVPRLLEAANRARMRPIALAEAWWGPDLNGRSHGDLQAPCERKCVPILGHLLCGWAS